MTNVPDPAQNSNTPQEKLCNGPCGRILPATSEYFNRNRNGKDGLKSLCKQCTSQKNRDYRKAHPEKEKAYLEAHREEKLQYAKEYRATHKEERKEYNRQYRIAHEDELKEYQSKKYRENIDKHRAKNKENYQKNAERNRQYAAKYRQEHAEQVQAYREAHRHAHRQYDVEYNIAHRDQKRIYRAQYRKTHSEYFKEYTAWYRQSEQFKIRARVNAHRRRSRRRNAQGSHTAKQLHEQLWRQKNRCYYCHSKLGKGRNNWHADHIVPLSKGGSDSIDNIVISCPDCNQNKHNKMLHEWDGGGGRLL